MDLLAALGILALLVRVGLTIYLAGISRAKNSATAVVRCVAELCGSGLLFAAFGAALLWQVHNPILGVRTSYLLAASPDAPALFFQTAALLTATSVVLGATAERSRLQPVLLASSLLAAVVLPICGNWIWYGWLSRLGAIDVAGALAFQWPAALCGLVAAATVGPRSGKYHRDGSTSVIPGHSAPLASVGVLVTMVGWIGYVTGSASLRLQPVEGAVADVFFATLAGGAAAMIYSRIRYGKLDLFLSLNGMLGALAAISAGAGVVGPRAAIIIGAGAGVLVPWVAMALDLLLKVDDPSGLIAAQGAGAVWGALATGVFATGASSHGLALLGVQALGVLATGGLSVALSLGLFYLTKAMTGLRSKEADEFDGLDLAEHDIGAYPDFQQNMIRSYHLREA